MLLLLCRLCVLKEYRNKYPSLLTWAGQLASEIILLTVYWYTAKSFVPNLGLSTGRVDYFTYIVVGETILFLPTLLITVFTRIFRAEIQQGTLEPTLVSSSSLASSWLAQAMGLSIVESLRIILVIALATLVFRISVVPFSSLLLIIILQIVAVPFFAGLGLIGASIMVFTGRGDRVIPMITTLMTVLAGAYFPPEVLPKSVYFWSTHLSPMSMLLETSREAIRLGWASPNWIQSAGLLAAYSLIFLALGFYMLNACARLYRRRPQPILVMT